MSMPAGVLLPDFLPSGRPVPEAWKESILQPGAFGVPYKPCPDIPDDGIGVDLIDATDRMCPRRGQDYNAVKASRIAVIHDSPINAEMPQATREYLKVHGKAGICCERPLCGKVQVSGEKVQLKRCSRVRRCAFASRTSRLIALSSASVSKCAIVVQMFVLP